MNTITINSELQTGHFLGNYTQKDVKQETMFFNSSAQFVLDNCGPITRKFITSLSEEFTDASNLIIDSRVHMLMPGWYPCIPGMHHDDVPRERSDGQPEYHNPSYKSKHCLAIFGGGARTKFAIGQASFPEVPINHTVYKVWHPIVRDYLEQGKLHRIDATFGQMYYFDWNTWHEGTPAYESAFRLFIRASINTNRVPSNEIRTQTQVYLDSPMEGW